MARIFAALCALVFATVATLASATVTDNSILACSPSDVVPGQNFSCNIYVRNELQQPTDAGNVNSFTVQVIPDITVAQVTLYPIAATADPSIFSFQVSSNIGTHVRIDVALASSGKPIKSSGFVGLVMEVPPTTLKNFKCDVTALYLRQTTTCSADATGAYGLPARVGAGDFYVSEDHGDGAFKYVSGDRTLTFTYTAPNYPSMTYDRFVLRLLLTGSVVGSELNVTLPLLYPPQAPTAASRLRCDSTTHCVLTALDATGPVSFSPALFNVSVQQQGTGGAWVAAPVWTSVTSVSGQMGSLDFGPVVDNRVYPVRVHVTVAATGVEISGSPYASTIGNAPTAQSLTFVKCRRTFVGVGKSTACYVKVADDVSADPTYLNATATVGSVVGVEYVNGSSLDDSELTAYRVLAITYAAPTGVTERTSVQLYMTVAGTAILRGPATLTVFPLSTSTETTKDRRAAVIAVCVIFFSVSFGFGVVAHRGHQHHMEHNTRVLIERQKKREAGLPPVSLVSAGPRRAPMHSDARNPPPAPDREVDEWETPPSMPLSAVLPHGAAAAAAAAHSGGALPAAAVPAPGATRTSMPPLEPLEPMDLELEHTVAPRA